MTMSNIEPRFSKPASFFWLFRPNRTIMVALITGAATFTAGAGYSRSLWLTLAGWFLAVGGFSLDLYADRDLDVEGTRSKIRRNPMADGSFYPLTGLIFSLTFIAASLVVTLLVAPWALLSRTGLYTHTYLHDGYGVCYHPGDGSWKYVRISQTLRSLSNNFVLSAYRICTLTNQY